MRHGSMVGTRIRERRLQNGIRQSDLARSAGISPSYLNLIEHNKRRIGGKTLIKLAEVLMVEPALLSEGAEAALIEGLHQAAGAVKDSPAELDRVEEFAGRFPGWAQLLSNIRDRCVSLEQTVETLTDRLAHDPNLAISLHEVISVVTSIHSTSSILTETKDLEPEWQSRFHRNINEDSARLVESAESLVRYLEGAPDIDADIRSPQDELHAFLSDNDFHFPELESDDAEPRIERVLGQSAILKTDPAKDLARAMLAEYVQDAQRLPEGALKKQIARLGIQPDQLAVFFGVDITTVFRRLAMLPKALAGPVGLVICDGTGTVTFRKPVMGFALPQSAGACALWPLYQVLSNPSAIIRRRLRQLGREQTNVQVLAVAETRAISFDVAPLVRPHMLILPDDPGASASNLHDVGVNCRICPIPGCTARREPSIIKDGF